MTRGRFLLGRNHVKPQEFCFAKLEFDLTTISFSAVTALGGIWLVFFSDSVDDDYDQDGGGKMSSIHEPAYAGSPV